MGFLTTHVLDTAKGCPAAGVLIELYSISDGHHFLSQASTNEDGRCDEPILQEADFQIGEYELLFHVGDYFSNNGLSLPQPKFLDHVVIRFGISDASQHYHVPLLISPFAYSTYRGS